MLKNQSDTRGWEVRLMLFKSIVVQVLIYGVEVGGDTISLSARDEHRQNPKIVFISSTCCCVMLWPREVVAIHRQSIQMHWC